MRKKSLAKEEGFYLPVMVAVATLLFLALWLLIEQLQTIQYAEQLEWERMKAKSAAMNGLEQMKHRLSQHPTDYSSITQQWEQGKVRVTVKRINQHKIRIQSVAYAMMEVKQTVSVEMNQLKKE